MAESRQPDDPEPADISPAELREAIRSSAPVIHGWLLSAFGELLEKDPAKAREALLRLDKVGIDLAARLRADDPGRADDPTTHAAPFFAAGLEIARQDGELTAEAVLRQMTSADDPGIDSSSLRDLLTAGTHPCSFDQSLVATLRLSEAGDLLRNETRLGWESGSDNARAVIELARAHREAERLATEIDVGAGLMRMFGVGGVAGGVWAIADEGSLIASAVVIGIGAAALLLGGATNKSGEPSLRQQRKTAKAALDTAASALHEPLVDSPEIASTARNSAGTTVRKTDNTPRRGR